MTLTYKHLQRKHYTLQISVTANCPWESDVIKHDISGGLCEMILDSCRGGLGCESRGGTKLEVLDKGSVY